MAPDSAKNDTLAMMKRVYGMQTDVKVVKETAIPTGATLSLEALAPDKKPIVGKAVAGEESGHDPQRKSGGQAVRALAKKPAVLQVRQPVFTEAEAKRRAQAILNDHAKKFLTGEAETIGLPDLQPDRNITLSNLGEPFSKTYYIQQTTHKADGGGYRTRVKVKETSL